MESISFEVGAKAARLIGRENIADVDGALVELIKNAYDADASCVLVYFDIPFPFAPVTITAEIVRRFFQSEKLNVLKKYYIQDEKQQYTKRQNLTEKENTELDRFLADYNRIVIADNGHGMDYEDVKTKWMYIGTSDKEENYQSPKGRIKTGAKGIGRFALDKLSLRSEMYTRKKEGKLVTWKLSWEQFEQSKLLSQVNADLSISEESYTEITEKYMRRVFPTIIREHDWNTGTLLVLHPTRENWSERLFEKVNTNLKSINPFGSVDPFKVIIRNHYYPDFDFETPEVAVDQRDFDYKISAVFDGERKLNVTLFRNEVDIHKRTVLFKKYDYRTDLTSFWSRPYFQREHYHKDDFSGTLIVNIDVTNVLKDDPARIKSVGPFEADIYFGKNANSAEEIIKQIPVKSRNRIYEVFSGIKLYRDNFKVRPYGDEGAYFDWLGLGKRQAASPGGVGDYRHVWKVLPYQLIGQVKISRGRNIGLYDMANREGLTPNDEYNIFREILLMAIDVFEKDRRSFYWEYTRWKEDIEKKIQPTEQVKADVVEKHGKKTKDMDTVKREYTEEEYRETVYSLIQENKQMLNAQQILQMLSSSGLILNTFFHEFRAFETQFGVRAPQLRERINHMQTYNDLFPNMIYDPHIIIDEMEKTDEVLASWLEVALEKSERQYLETKTYSLLGELKIIANQWAGLLGQKDIQISIMADDENDFLYSFAKADLYIIINNFMLNAIYFIGKSKKEQHRIIISIEELKGYYKLRLWNDGAGLDVKYEKTPDKIFELGESSKENVDGTSGTGIGLWIMKAAIDRYGGSIFVSKVSEGFGLDIYLTKQERTKNDDLQNRGD